MQQLLNDSTKSTTTKEKIGQLNLDTVYSLDALKNSLDKIRQSPESEKKISDHLPDKGLLEHTKDLLHLSNETQIIQFLK